MYIYWISIEGTISANFIKGYSIAIQPIFSKIWKFLILLYLSSFPSKNNILWLFFDNLLKSFSENLKQLTKMNDFLLILCFHENRRILSCFHHRYEFCMQKYHSKCISIEFLYKAKFRLILSKAITLRFTRFSQKFENFWFCFICLLCIQKLYLTTFCDNLLKNFSENLKQLTKMNDILLFLRFYENRRILHCFHCRYEFCLQKYPSKCIFIEFP